MNPMSVADYIKNYNLSEEEAKEKVLKNRRSLKASLERKSCKQIFKKVFPNSSFDENFMLETYLKFKGIKLLNWAVLAKEICDHFGYDIEYSLSYLYDKITFYNGEYKRPLLRVIVIKDIFGENSPRHQRILEKCKKSATCSFDIFKEKHKNDLLSEEELYQMFRETYGSCNTNRLKKVYNVDDEGAREIINSRLEKTKKTWSEKDEEELNRIYKSKGRSEENYILKYGEELGKIKYQEVLAGLKGIGSLSWYIEKFGEDEGKQVYSEKRGKHNVYCCPEYWKIRGYSEEETVLILKDVISKRKNFSKEYCIEKYGYDHGIEIWKARQISWQNTLKSKSEEEIEEINKKKAITPENLINKYGQEEGIQKYNEWKEKISKKYFVSKASIKFFVPLYKILRKLKLVEREDVRWGIAGSKEFFLRDKETFLIRFYDFVIPKYNIIIEYNGKCFHPKEGDYEWKSPYGKTYEEIFPYDRQKEDIAKRFGYKVFYVWEEDLMEDYENILVQTTDIIIETILEGK